MNLFSILEDSARRWPEDTAVVHGGRSFSYSELCAAAESLAIKLRQAGVQAGDKVGLMCERSAEYIVAFFAVLRAGGILVPISPALKALEVMDLASEMALDAFCYSAEFASRIPEGDSRGMTEMAIAPRRPPLRVELASTRATLQGERDQLLKINAACLGFTSGTTSTAKGIILSHTTFVERAEIHWQPPPLTKGSRVLWLRSMDRILPHQVSRCLLEGAEIIIANAMALEPLQRLIAAHAIDQIYAGPLFFRMLIQRGLTKEDLHSVRYCISGGSSLPNSVAEDFRARFGLEIGQRYGLNECGPVLVNFSEDPSKRGSVGKPVPGREVKLAPLESDSSEGETIGEILVRGSGLFDGYYRPWRLRDEVLEDGWFRTGDIARRDADGYYWIVGRVKDVINVGGVKVFPREIEELLLTHPAVEEAIVYGVPEARFGEVPHARVKLCSGAVCTERELLLYVNEKLSVFKALHAIEFVDEIPKTVTGKTRRMG